MKSTLPSLYAALLAALVASGCGQARQQGKPGQVKVAFKANGHSPSSASLTLPALCADVTLAPSSLDANGQATSAGAPIVLTKAGAASGTLQIAGCIDTLASPAKDWQYLVTATNIGPCDPADTLPGVPSPSVVTTVVNLDCQAGLDVGANVAIDVSIPVPNAGGYVDITTTVNATEVEVGCKQADHDSRDPSLLNFGMSQFSATQAGLSSGILGVIGGAAPATQFQSQLHAGGSYQQFYTGQFPFPDSSSLSFQQSLVGSCAAGSEFHGSNTPTCHTYVGDTGETSTFPSLTTATSIGPTLAAWVDLTVGGQLFFVTASSAIDLLQPGAAFGSLSAYNGTARQQLSAAAPCTGFSGVWPSNQDAGQFVATCSDGAGATYWTTLSFDGTAWTAAAVQPLAGASGLTLSEISCLGLFGASNQAACAAPTGAVCVPVTKAADAGIEVLFATHFVKGESRVEYLKAFEKLNFSSARVAAVIDETFAGAPNVRLNGLVVAAARAAVAADAQAYLAGLNGTLAKVAAKGPITVAGFNGLIGSKAIGPWIPLPFGGTVGGSILGLTGSGLVLASPGQANLAKAAGSTSFVFGTFQGGFTPFAVTVQTQPAGQTCVVSNGVGTLLAGVTNVVVACGPSTYTKVSTSQVLGSTSYTLAIASDGTLWGWGENPVGNLGLGDLLPRAVPTQIGTSTWIDVAAGLDSAVAVRADGTLWSWGHNGFGQLGNGTLVPSTVPLQVGTSTGWTKVAAGLYSATGINNGGLYEWGYANGNPSVPTQLGSATNWASVTGKIFLKSAIKTDGTLWLWYNNIAGVPQSAVPVQYGTAHWLAADAYTNYMVLIRADHTLWSAGYNWYGQLGYGPADTTNTIHPLTQIGTASDWTAVSVASRSVAALRGPNGDLYTWGWNTIGMLADGTTTSSVAPQLTPVGTGYTAVFSYLSQGFALKATGELYGWGANAGLGVGITTGYTNTPVQIP